MFTLNCKGRLLTIDEPVVMGIINTTPDSFFTQSRIQTIEAALQTTEAMLSNGAVMIDVGGQSTRPGSEIVGADEESERVVPVIEAIHKHHPEAFISVDTYYAAVAENAVAAGASIINDISGGNYNTAILNVAARYHTPYICMHIKGNAGEMHVVPDYDDVTKEVLDYFINKIPEWKQHHINDVIIDPGFGFSKNISHNFTLLKNLSVFKMLDKPILAGLSRKSTIYKTLQTTPENALNGTTVLNTIALLNGANILRVHDVKEAREAIQLVTAYK